MVINMTINWHQNFIVTILFLIRIVEFCRKKIAFFTDLNDVKEKIKFLRFDFAGGWSIVQGLMKAHLVYKCISNTSARAFPYSSLHLQNDFI